MAGARNQQIPIVALSATCADNPLRMKALGFALGLFNLRGFWPWALKHGVRKTMWGHEYDRNVRNMRRIHEKIFPHKGTRLRWEDLGDIAPKTVILPESYPMDDGAKIQKLYEEMTEEIKEHNEIKGMDINPNHPLTKHLRQRQEVELLKVPTFVELTKDAIEEGMSVVVFVNFTQTLEVLIEKLNAKCFIYGGQNKTQRDAHRDRFLFDEERVIIVNAQAGGESLDLHDLRGEYPRLALISPGTSASGFKQVLGRVRRADSKSTSIQKIVFAEGTIEEKVCRNIERKLANLDALNDNDLNGGLHLL